MSSYITELLFAIIALVAVITLAWLVIKAIKKVHTFQHQGNPLKTELILPLGSRERIMVVSYKNTEYIVGVTPDSINLIDKQPVTQDNALVDDKPPHNH